MSICQRISKVIALTSVSGGIWIWCWVEGNLYMHTHFQHRAIRLISVTLNNLKLFLHPSCFLAHVPSPLWLHDSVKGLWLLYFSYCCVHTYNHDYLSQLQETTADCFIGFLFCSLEYIFTLFVSVQHFSAKLLRVKFFTLTDLTILLLYYFGTQLQPKGKLSKESAVICHDLV